MVIAVPFVAGFLHVDGVFGRIEPNVTRPTSPVSPDAIGSPSSASTSIDGCALNIGGVLGGDMHREFGGFRWDLFQNGGNGRRLPALQLQIGFS